ncbi:hypothetical protein RRG08_058697 [Elysia crispata]|uniref:Uncharacterized protein n=1 Tax=Elysia crispata TaxID=231223 RepID=A0AAE0YY76_9GAST|nr:hypothetical protein RRG08_058697 [Elysia crispata]
MPTRCSSVLCSPPYTKTCKRASHSPNMPTRCSSVLCSPPYTKSCKRARHSPKCHHGVAVYCAHRHTLKASLNTGAVAVCSLLSVEQCIALTGGAHGPDQCKLVSCRHTRRARALFSGEQSALARPASNSPEKQSETPSTLFALTARRTLSIAERKV